MTPILRETTVTPEEQRLQKQLLSAEISCDLLLRHIPQIFGQLVWISSFALDTSPEIRSHEFAPSIAPKIANLALNHAHKRVFTQWLGLRLEEQYKDLAEYLAGEEAAEQLTSPNFGLRRLIPPSAVDAERMLFLSELETIMQLMKFEDGVVLGHQLLDAA